MANQIVVNHGFILTSLTSRGSILLLECELHYVPMIYCLGVLVNTPRMYIFDENKIVH